MELTAFLEEVDSSYSSPPGARDWRYSLACSNGVRNAKYGRIVLAAVGDQLLDLCAELCEEWLKVGGQRHALRDRIARSARAALVSQPRG